MLLEQETEPPSPCLKYPPFPFIPVLSQINLSTRSLPLSLGFILMSSFHFSTVLQVISFLLFLLKSAILVHFWWHAPNYPLFIIIFFYGNEKSVPVHTINACEGPEPNFTSALGTSEGRLRSPAVLCSIYEFSLLFELEAVCVLVSVWMLSKVEKSVASAGNRTMIARFPRP